MVDWIWWRTHAGRYMGAPITKADRDRAILLDEWQDLDRWDRKHGMIGPYPPTREEAWAMIGELADRDEF